MILKEKGILDSTMVKIIAKILRDNPQTKGFKVNTLKGTVVLTYEEIVKFAETLSEEMNKGNYDEIRKCSTCGNFSYPGRKGAKGCCFPKEFTSFRKVNDYCSQWVPMTTEQQYIRRRMNELRTLQTERAGDGSEDSKESP